MSVWSTLGQMVQGTLEQALGEEEINENVNDTVEDTPPVSTDDNESDNVYKLQERLKDMETQNQLLNAEYSKLLREKEEELVRLRGQQQQQPLVDGEDEVVRLKRILEEKEKEVQELNAKAETKFIKLKAQAKSKIAKLQEELQQLKDDSSVGVANTSQDSLNLSIQSISNKDEISILKEKVSSLQEIITDKETTITNIKTTLNIRDKELEENKMELCKQKEEEHERIKELSQRLSIAEEQIKSHTAAISDYELKVTELNTIISNQTDSIEQNNNNIQTQLKMDLEKEKEEKIKLSQQVVELLHKMDDDKRMTRDLSFASSEFQIVSQVPSDSEEEWKIIRTSESGSGSSEGKETSPPPEILSITREDSPLTKSSVSGLPSQADKQKAIIAEMENTLASKEAEIELLTSQIVQTTEKFSIASEKILSLEKERETNQWDVAETSWGFEETDGKSKEVEELKETITKLTSDIERICEELTEACDSLRLKSNELLQVSQENNNQIKTIEELRNQISDNMAAERDNNRMSDLIDRLKQDIEDKDNLIGQLEKEKAGNVTNELQLSAVLADKDQVNNQMLKMEEELRNSFDERKSLETTLRKKEEEMTAIVQEKEVVLKEKEDICKEKRDLEEMVEKREVEHDRIVEEKEKKLKCGLSEKDNVIQKLHDEKLRLSQEIETRNSELRALEELQEREKNERENLREEMKRMSNSNQTFSSDSAKCREELMTMEGQLDGLKRERNQLVTELETNKELLRKLERQSKNDKKKRAELEEELKKYTQETGQLKNQFDSAVELLQQENNQLKANLTTSQRECSQRVSVCEMLQEQVKSEGNRSMGLKDTNRTLTHELKGLNERCTSLERERNSLNQQLIQLTREHEQLTITLEASINDRQALTQETNSTRKSNEVYESHVMELTNQIAVLVHEKDTADETVRRLQREIVVKERHETDLKEKIELIQNDIVGQTDWTEEKQSLLDSYSQLQSELFASKQETNEREATIDNLNKTMEEMQVQCKMLKTALATAKGLMSESTKNESDRITELEKRLTDMTYAHKLELSNAQTCLREEQERRETIEVQLQQQRGSHDITVINIEDTSLEEPTTDNGGVGGKDNFAAVKKWIQRFVKNPNIVLVRLVRATPQTQLVFITYLVLLHLILLYMMLT